MYRQFFKRFFDFTLSLLGIIILIPFFLIFTPVVAIGMHGNPFFIQKRPGKDEKIFSLIKYRTMTNKKDKNGVLLPDTDRLTTFGKIMRKLSVDELPELFNILIGDMSIVGPRPLLVSYLPYYTSIEKQRHSIRPGLTGLAQVNGRNNVKWDKRLYYDVLYVNEYSLGLDIKILFDTVSLVFASKDVEVNTDQVETNLAEERAQSVKQGD